MRLRITLGAAAFDTVVGSCAAARPPPHLQAGPKPRSATVASGTDIWIGLSAPLSCLGGPIAHAALMAGSRPSNGQRKASARWLLSLAAPSCALLPAAPSPRRRRQGSWRQQRRHRASPTLHRGQHRHGVDMTRPVAVLGLSERAQRVLSAASQRLARHAGRRLAGLRGHRLWLGTASASGSESFPSCNSA